MILIDREKCTGCGICGIICPRHVLETQKINGERMTILVEERMDVCMGCGQCVAVCPNDALSIDDLPADGFNPAPSQTLNYDALMDFFSRRRSVRRYKDKPVERDVLDRIARASGMAPAGAGRASTGLIVIDRPETLRRLSNYIFRVYESLDKALKNPLGRMIVGFKAGKKQLKVLDDFVMPGMRWYIRWKNEGMGDEILRDCPALFLFHSPKFEPVGKENCVIAAWHAIFAAEALEVGTCMNDLIPPACNQSWEIRDMLGLPPGREVMVSLTLGYPKYKYLKTIPRELASLKYLD